MGVALNTIIAALRGAYTPFDIWLLIGQSNMSGRGTIDSALDAATPHVYEFGGYSGDSTTYQLIRNASNPLHNPDYSLSQALGPGTAFGNQYFANTGRRVLLVPAAVGATSLVAGYYTQSVWSPYGTNNASLLFAIAQANAAIAAAQSAASGSRFAGCLWLQGEGDGANGATQAQYQQALVDLILAVRAGVTGAANTPFLLGQMLPEAISVNIALPSGTAGAGTYPAIDAAHTAVAAGVSKCYKISIGTGYDNGDHLHYSAPGDRLNGVTYANAVPLANANTGDATPTQVVGVTPGTPTASTCPVTWTATSGARNYTVQYSSDGGTTWNTVVGTIPNTSSLTNSVTIGGLSGSQAYLVRVRANAYGSTPNGPYSTNTSFTTASALADAYPTFGSITGSHISVANAGTNTNSITVTNGAAYATDHAGTTNLSMPANVDGSLRISLPSSTGTGFNTQSQIILGLILSQTDPAYSAGASGYKFGMINYGNSLWRVVYDGGTLSNGNGAQLAPATGDIARLVRSGGTILAQVARAATPNTFTTIHTFASTSTAQMWGGIDCSQTSGASATYGPLVGNGWA